MNSHAKQTLTEHKTTSAELIKNAEKEITEQKFNSQSLTRLAAHTLRETEEKISRSEAFETFILTHARSLNPTDCSEIPETISINGQAHYNADHTHVVIHYNTLTALQIAQVVNAYQVHYGRSVVQSINWSSNGNDIYFDAAKFVNRVLPVMNGLPKVIHPGSITGIVIEHNHGYTSEEAAQIDAVLDKIDTAINPNYKSHVRQCHRFGYMASDDIFLSHLATLMPQTKELYALFHKIDASRKIAAAPLPSIPLPAPRTAEPIKQRAPNPSFAEKTSVVKSSSVTSTIYQGLSHSASWLFSFCKKPAEQKAESRANNTNSTTARMN